ncbi:MAG: hypothetical protein ABIB97_00340 [Patescibacteria group bacterium]
MRSKKSAKTWDNHKGLASALSIIVLVVLSGGMGAGIWAFSRAEIVNFGEGIEIQIDEYQSVLVTELAKSAKNYAGQKIEVVGLVKSGQNNTCLIEESGRQFEVECWAPINEPPPVNTNVPLAPTRTMSYYFDKKWVLNGEVVPKGSGYYLTVESYNAL